MKQLVFLCFTLEPGRANTQRVVFNVINETPLKMKVEDSRAGGVIRWVKREQLEKLNRSGFGDSQHIVVAIWTLPENEKKSREDLKKALYKMLDDQKRAVEKMEEALRVMVCEVPNED